MKRSASTMWFNISDKIRFLIVGGWNTLFSIVIFAILLKFLHYKLSLVISHFTSVINSFLCFKFLVFRARGHIVKEFIKINLVYAIYFVLNFVMLVFAVNTLQLNPIVAQIIIIGILTIYAYLMNKYFAFK